MAISASYFCALPLYFALCLADLAQAISAEATLSYDGTDNGLWHDAAFLAGTIAYPWPPVCECYYPRCGSINCPLFAYHLAGAGRVSTITTRL